MASFLSWTTKVANANDVHNMPIENNNDGGWKCVHVFYGSNEILLRQHKSWINANTRRLEKSYLPPELSGKGWTGQVLQDLVVYNLLGKKENGYFIDLASNHAVVHSNSYALESFYGWNGVCIDANPGPWESLSARKCHVVGAVVGSTRMKEVQFHAPKDNTYVSRIVDGWEDNFSSAAGRSNTKNIVTDSTGEEVRTRFTMSLTEILQKFRVPKVIDYISFDVEGAEGYILSGATSFLENYTVKIWTVENPDKIAIQQLQKFGYKCLKKLTKWGETVWAHESFLHQLDFKTKNMNMSLEEAESLHWTCGL